MNESKFFGTKNLRLNLLFVAYFFVWDFLLKIKHGSIKAQSSSFLTAMRVLYFVKFMLIIQLNTVRTKTKNELARQYNSKKITVNHKGGSHKRKYLQIDFYRTENSLDIVCAIEHCSNRSADIIAANNFNRNCFFTYQHLN